MRLAPNRTRWLARVRICNSVGVRRIVISRTHGCPHPQQKVNLSFFVNVNVLRAQFSQILLVNSALDVTNSMWCGYFSLFQIRNPDRLCYKGYNMYIYSLPSGSIFNAFSRHLCMNTFNLPFCYITNVLRCS